MANDEGSTKHLKESDEGDHDLSEGVGEDEATIEVESLSADLKARDSGRSSLNATAGDDVQVERVAAAYCSQLDDLAVLTWTLESMQRSGRGIVCSGLESCDSIDQKIAAIKIMQIHLLNGNMAMSKRLTFLR